MAFWSSLISHTWRGLGPWDLFFFACIIITNIRVVRGRGREGNWGGRIFMQLILEGQDVIFFSYPLNRFKTPFPRWKCAYKRHMLFCQKNLQQQKQQPPYELENRRMMTLNAEVWTGKEAFSFATSGHIFLSQAFLATKYILIAAALLSPSVCHCEEREKRTPKKQHASFSILLIDFRFCHCFLGHFVWLSRMLKLAKEVKISF